MIGERLRRAFGDPAKLMMGWSLIDVFARLEEREEALRDGDEETESGDGPSHGTQAPGDSDKDKLAGSH